MRILKVVHQYPPEYVGGTELYTQTLARYLVKKGHDVTVFFPSQNEPADIYPEIALKDDIQIAAVRLGPRSRRQVFLHTFRHPEVTRAFREVLAGVKPDLVHIQHLMGLPLSLPALAREMGIPVIITIHDYWYVCANAQLVTNYDQSVCQGPDKLFVNCGRCALVRGGRPGWQWAAPAVAPLMAYRNYSLDRIFRSASYLVAPSAFVGDIYQQLGAPVEKLIVIPHGIELPAPDMLPSRKQKDRSLPGRSRPLHVGYVGSINRQKGVHNLIEAVNHLPGEAIRLTIYGNLSTFPDYSAYLRRQADHPGIRFMGQVSREQLWPAMADFDLLAFPTLWYEASPLIIQEAFAMGLPIVASKIGAVPEKIIDGVDGLLVPPDDVKALSQALMRFCNEPALLPTLRRGIRPVQTIEDHLEEIIRLYESTRS